MKPFYIINKIPKINSAHWNLPWMSYILKFRSLKISLETFERSFHREEKTEILPRSTMGYMKFPLLSCTKVMWEVKAGFATSVKQNVWPVVYIQLNVYLNVTWEERPTSICCRCPVHWYRIYWINRPGRLLNFWTLRMGAYSRLGAYQLFLPLG